MLTSLIEGRSAGCCAQQLHIKSRNSTGQSSPARENWSRQGTQSISLPFEHLNPLFLTCR